MTELFLTFVGRIARLANEEKHHNPWIPFIFFSLKYPAAFQEYGDMSRTLLDSMMIEGLLIKCLYAGFKIMSLQKAVFLLISIFVNDYLNIQSGKIKSFSLSE